MQKISEYKQDDLIYNHVVYDSQTERHFAKHAHSLLEMIYVLQGEVSYTIENKQFVAKRGDCIVIKPYAYHYFSVSSKNDYEKIGVLVKEQDAPSLFGEQEFLLLRGGKSKIDEIFLKLDFYFQNCPQPTFIELLSALARELLINLRLFHATNAITEHTQIHPIIERAIAHINTHLFTLGTLQQLAQALSVSEGYLKALFTQQMKIPPKKYITEKRMLRARELITSGIPPTQAAFQCGYANYTTFYRLYVKIFGCPPQASKSIP